VDREAIADLFTYFDCTEYRDFTDYNPTGQPLAANVLTLDGQRSPLRFWAYLRLFVGFASFTPGKFPKGGRDVHGGYFAGQFCKLLLYRLAFLGLQGLLDSLIETTPDELGLTTTLPASLEADLARVRAARRRSEGAIAVPGPSSHNKPPQGQPDQRRVALTYLSWLLEQKRIQAVFSPERYQVEVLGRDRNDVREGILTQTLPPTQR
jgi:hypothetical protein